MSAVVALLLLGAPVAPGADAAGTPHQRQFEIKISSVIAAQRDAATYTEWIRTGLLPESVRDLANRLGSAPALCSALLGLSGRNLAVFETVLKENPELVSESCLKRLLVRVRKHWASQRAQLEAIAGPETKANKLPRLEPLEVGIDHTTGPVFFKGGLGDSEFALTFDDGPDGYRTPRVARALRAAGARATFFPIGADARRHPEIIRDLAADGHSIGSHTWSHDMLTDLDSEEARAEIDNGWLAVQQIIGSFSAPFFRFPYGARNTDIQEYVRGSGLATFFWNLDSLDWKIYDSTVLYDHILREMEYRKGGVILMHATLEQTALMLPYLLARFREQSIRPAVFVSR